MPRNSSKNAGKRKHLDPTITVALIGLAGTIIAALLASPLLERLFSSQPSAVATPVQTSNTNSGTQISGNHIRLNQTVTGTLYGAEAGTWIFAEGPATVTIILDVGPFGDALIILKDPSGIERAYRDQQTRPGVTRLVNFFYTLTVQDALTPPPPSLENWLPRMLIVGQIANTAPPGTVRQDTLALGQCQGCVLSAHLPRAQVPGGVRLTLH